MTEELLEIQPRELKFIFELKKQSSCAIQLGNKSDQYVAFKVKTTSPKKYYVRPNMGIIRPNAARNFTVIMQAHRVAPPDLKCKDKFLIQSTVVPLGTSEEDITSGMFANESGKHIEEKKIKVILMSPVQSPVLLPVNGKLTQDPPFQSSLPKDRMRSGVENVPPSHRNLEGVEALDVAPANVTGFLKAASEMELRVAENGEELLPSLDPEKLKLAEDFEELKSKLSMMNSKLKEAELTIASLTEERSMHNREKDAIKHDLEMLRKNGGRVVRVGFPLLYVCMVALVALAIGYMVHT